MGELVLNEALSVSSISAESDADDLTVANTKPIEARRTFDIRESVQCEEVTAIPNQGVIWDKKLEVGAASLKIVPSYPLEIDQVQSLDKPDKYFPALFVATERATSRFNTENAIITTENGVRECESSCPDQRIPPTQTAHVALSLRESTSV